MHFGDDRPACITNYYIHFTLQRAWFSSIVDEYGNRREVDIAEWAMPMQKIYGRLQMTPKQIAEFCQKWHIAELAAFGSILREDFRQSERDVDFLFCDRPNTNMSLLRRVRMKVELEEPCARPADLVMFSEVMASHTQNRRKNVLGSATLIYVEG